MEKLCYLISFFAFTKGDLDVSSWDPNEIKGLGIIFIRLSPSCASLTFSQQGHSRCIYRGKFPCQTNMDVCSVWAPKATTLHT